MGDGKRQGFLISSQMKKFYHFVIQYTLANVMTIN